MKKLFIMLCLCTMAVCANAQKFGVWYGVNLASVGGDLDEADSEMKFLNIGVDYTAPINDVFDWSVGAAYVTKGAKDWDPSFIQIDANARWNFWQSDEAKVGILAGPYVGYMINDDDIDATGLEANKLDFGIGAGIMGTYSNFSLKLGYEFGITDAIDGPSSPLSSFYIRVGYSF